MAKGDVKYVKYSSGGSYHGGNSYSDYDDEGWGGSKLLYEKFVRLYKKTSDLFNDSVITDTFIKLLLKYATYRYNVHDFYDQYDNDGRVKRLIEQNDDTKTWQKFLHRVELIKENMADEQWIEGLANRIANYHREKEWQVEREAREAERLVRLEEETAHLQKQVDLVKGALTPSFSSVFQIEEVYYQRQGDWLDDPVSAYITGYGFGEEVRKPGGVKVQITLSIDLSNSMYHNKVAKEAVTVFRELGLSLKELSTEHQGNLNVAFFEFSLDENWGGKLGRQARRLVESKYDPNSNTDFYLGELESYRNPYIHSIFSGQDTWMYPLFEEIEKWENKESDSGSVRLDLVISDAVLEHPTDITKSDEIQERRNGNLQTVILNLMPEWDWHNGALPKRCVQYPVTTDNLAGVARMIIGEFLAIQL